MPFGSNSNRRDKTPGKGGGGIGALDTTADDDWDSSGIFDNHHSNSATPLLSGRHTSTFETSLPDEARIGRFDVIGPYTQNAASCEDRDCDVIVETSPGRRGKRFASLHNSWEAARQFVRSNTHMLSTHSTVESDALYKQTQCSNTQTLMHLIKATAGTGILSLPLAFKHSGLWVGLVCFLFISVVAVHCMHLINRCTGILEKRTGCRIENYAETMELCLSYGPKCFHKYGEPVKQVVNVLVQIMQCSFCCVYIVWVSVNIKEVFDQYLTTSPNVRVYESIVFLFLLPYLMIKSLRKLAIFSAFANCIYFIGLVIIFQYLFRDLPDVKKRPAFASWSTLPMFFGTSIFAFESICFLVPLRSKVKNLDDLGGWTGILNLGMTIVVAVYTALAFYGYLKFGEDTAATITLNLPTDEWLYQSVKLIFATAIFLSIAVQFYVPIDVIWPAVENKIAAHRSDRFKMVAQCITRAILAFLIFVIAVLVPHVDLLMSLVGSLFGALFCITFPAAVNMITLYEEGDLTAIIVIKDTILIGVGCAGLATGTYYSLVDIVDTF